MNKRIEELAEQTKVFMNGSDDLDVFIEKFSDLLIQECIKAIETNKANLTFDAYSDAVWEIEDHFKV